MSSDVRNEIGGYIEFEQYSLPMLHEKAIALNSARGCLQYLIRSRKIEKILLPKWICESVINTCEKEHLKIQFYSIGKNFFPENIVLEEDEWLYIVNYYGQLTNHKIDILYNQYQRIIVDQTQAYFQMPVKNVDTLFSCRKYFGVPDGGLVYTDSIWEQELPRDESFQRMNYLMGRYERTASEFYNEYIMNEKKFDHEPLKSMSKLTFNLLHSIDYDEIKKKRVQNFTYLHHRLKGINNLQLIIPEGPFMYPLYMGKGQELRKKLLKEKIYVPVLWPNVLKQCKEEEWEYDLACNILPLPVDQRYSYSEMDMIATQIEQNL